ncbi:B-cell receptor CD22-like [Ptychodera flava]|uniref:B-cell receptor CD22-like n=1 Tax=Ptychodera flava TaxID=63121 RepID=UPI00396A5FE6
MGLSMIYRSSLAVEFHGNISTNSTTVEGDSFSAEYIVKDAEPQPQVISWFNGEGTKVSQHKLLEFDTVLREQAGNYTCKATSTFWDETTGNSMNGVSLYVQYIPSMNVQITGNASDTARVIEGRSFSVECVVLDSDPSHDNITWFDGDGNVISFNELVEFKDISRNKSGNYTCIATTPFWGGRKGTGTTIMNVDVEYPPFVNEQTVFCVEHDLDVISSCIVLSNPSPSFYVWARNGDLLVREYNYVINKASRSDSGNYTCTATNVFYDETNATGSGITELRVQYLSDVTMSTTPWHNITEGSDVAIYCQAFNGNPNPYKINITFEGETIAESDESALYHNLASISRTQDRNYQCNAMTKVYDQREDLSTDEIQITVFFSARISSEESRVYEASVGDDVSMECTADGNPSPTIRWFNNRNETLSHGDDNSRIENVEAGEITSVLTLKIGSNSFGIYTCEAYTFINPSDFQLMTINEIGNCDTEIANGPIDTISFVGYPSQMNCTLSEYINNAAWAYLSDSNRPIGISLGDVVFNDAYELITNQTSGFYVYNLYIANVTTSINYVHLCEIYGSDPVVSKEAMLHVLSKLF